MGAGSEAAMLNTGVKAGHNDSRQTANTYADAWLFALHNAVEKRSWIGAEDDAQRDAQRIDFAGHSPSSAVTVKEGVASETLPVNMGPESLADALWHKESNPGKWLPEAGLGVPVPFFSSKRVALFPMKSSDPFKIRANPSTTLLLFLRHTLLHTPIVENFVDDFPKFVRTLPIQTFRPEARVGIERGLHRQPASIS
jgi:hypothetical protein